MAKHDMAFLICHPACIDSGLLIFKNLYRKEKQNKTIHR